MFSFWKMFRFDRWLRSRPSVTKWFISKWANESEDAPPRHLSLSLSTDKFMRKRIVKEILRNIASSSFCFSSDVIEMRFD